MVSFPLIDWVAFFIALMGGYKGYHELCGESSISETNCEKLYLGSVGNLSIDWLWSASATK